MSWYVIHVLWAWDGGSGTADKAFGPFDEAEARKKLDELEYHQEPAEAEGHYVLVQQVNRYS